MSGVALTQFSNVTFCPLSVQMMIGLFLVGLERGMLAG